MLNEPPASQSVSRPEFVHIIRGRTRCRELFGDGNGAGRTALLRALEKPDLRACEEALARLEEADASLCFASGMAAITGVTLHVLSAGDHVIFSEICYAGVAEFGHDALPRLSIAVSRNDMCDPTAVAVAMRPETRLIHIETPCNPTLALTDIAAMADIAHAGGARLSVVATVGSPIATRVCDFGADYGIHSLTKYVSGHGDVLGGVVSGKADLIAALRKDAGVRLGATMQPMSAWLTLRSLPKLQARITMHEASAVKVARYLERREDVTLVNYPGLASHPQHDLAERQMANTSGLLSFTLDGDPRQVLSRLPDSCHIRHAISLGKPDSLLFYLATYDLRNHSFRLRDKGYARLRSAIGDGVFRMSVGLEDPDAIIDDLDILLG